MCPSAQLGPLDPRSMWSPRLRRRVPEKVVPEGTRRYQKVPEGIREGEGGPAGGETALGCRDSERGCKDLPEASWRRGRVKSWALSGGRPTPCVTAGSELGSGSVINLDVAPDWSLLPFYSCVVQGCQGTSGLRSHSEDPGPGAPSQDCLAVRWMGVEGVAEEKRRPHPQAGVITRSRASGYGLSPQETVRALWGRGWVCAGDTSSPSFRPGT